MTQKPKYHRVLLKISGESLMEPETSGIGHGACMKIAQEIHAVAEMGVQIGIVVGGGNIFRGTHSASFGFHRTSADQIGMLATMINGIALQQTLNNLQLNARVMSAIECLSIVDSYRWNQAVHLLENRGIPIFVGGTGNPYFTTDTAAALRASEIGANVLLKATKVNGVYDKDPLKNSDATHLPSLTYEEVLTKPLGVMDLTAIALCRENHIPIYVFNIFYRGALKRVVLGEEIGSLISTSKG